MKRALLVFERLLILASITSVAYVGYEWWKARSTQIRGRDEINRVITNPAPNALAEGTMLGEIEIPRIGLSSVILEGTEPATLRTAVGHIRGTALPGQLGNVAIAGHRDTFFRPLRNVRIGDEVIIRTHSGTAVYRVQSTQVVHPENVEVLDNIPAGAVTLVTCYPFRYIGAASERLVVRATRNGQSDQNNRIAASNKRTAALHRDSSGPSRPDRYYEYGE